MGRPFNFFGFVKPPFVLQGAFLFKDDYHFRFYWSGELSGAFREDYNLGVSLNHNTGEDNISGSFLEGSTLDLNLLPNAGEDTTSGIFLEGSTLGNDLTGKYSGVFTENCSLLIKCTGSYSEERVEIMSFGADITGSLKEVFVTTGYLGNDITKVGITGTFEEGSFLGVDLPSGKLSAGVETLEEGAFLGSSVNGIYSAIPEEE